MTMTLFGPAWVTLLFALVAVGAGTHVALRGRPMRERRRGLAVLAAACMASSVTFHVAYLSDPTAHFPLWQNLPLHLCTIVSFLLLPAVLTNARPLQVLCFFPGAAAGFLAFFSAAPMYWDHPVASAKTFFFVAHGLNFVVPAVMATLGVYRPTARDAVRSLGYTVVLALVVLPVTLLLRAVADPGANYMYVFDPEGAPILELFHHLIPVPLLYELPLLVAVAPVLLLQAALYRVWAAVDRRLLRGPGYDEPGRDEWVAVEPVTD
jgi:uncharacterized membrane protein YwaF